MNISLERKQAIFGERKRNRNTENTDIFAHLYNLHIIILSIVHFPLALPPVHTYLPGSARGMENDGVFLQSFSKMKDIKSGNFATKLHSLLANPSHEEIIAWADNKTAIQVIDQQRMESDILPLYFRQTKFESFVRQLNLYGFRRVKTQQSLKFTHPLLQQGRDLSSIFTAKVTKGTVEVIKERGEPEPQTRLVIPVESPNNEVGQDGGIADTVGQNRSSTDQIKNNPVRPQNACSTPFCFPQVVYFAINPFLFWNFPPFAPSNSHDLPLQADGLM